MGRGLSVIEMLVFFNITCNQTSPDKLDNCLVVWSGEAKKDLEHFTGPQLYTDGQCQ